jgi:rhodanese-related sulfurtransferase
MKTRVAIPIISVILIALFCTSCATGTGGSSGRTIEIVRLTPKDAYAFIQTNRNNPEFVLIDIRTPNEYRDGYIETAINMSLHSPSFEADINKLDKGKTYLIYCRTGSRVAVAVKMMGKAGFKKVYVIAGDIVKWKSEGLPLVK